MGTRPDLEEFAARNAAASPDPTTNKQMRVGLGFTDMDPRLVVPAQLPKAGAFVVEVAAGSAAERAGLRRGMVIVEAAKKPIRGRDDLTSVLAEGKSGTVLVMRVAFPGRLLPRG